MTARPKDSMPDDDSATRAAQRRQLLAQRLARAAATTQPAAAHRSLTAFEDTDDDDATAPLSFSQEALWFLDQLAGPNGAWNIALKARLCRIDPGTLQRSLQALIERHDPLRTALVDREGEPRQRVVDDATIALPIEDLADVPADLREDELARRMHERALEPFDLSRAPLLRARLYRLVGEDYALLIVVHHIVSDGWSRSVIARELAALYRGYESGAPAALPPLPVSFGRFARWQRSRARDGALRPSLEYWKIGRAHV